MFAALAALRTAGGMAGAAIAGAFAFFRTPLGQVIGIALLCLGVYVVGFARGRNHEVEICNTRVATVNAGWQKRVDQAAADFAQARTGRDAGVLASISASNAARVRELAADKATLERQVADYAARINSNPKPACLVTEEDLQASPKKGRR